MTDHLNTLRLLHSFAQGDHREALEAAIERFSLPVIETCGACSHCDESPDIGNVNDRCAHPLAEQSGQWPEPDATCATSAPPGWCPLRNQSTK